MKRDYIDFQDRSSPLAYLITFRCYGTWLHGDERGSMDRREFNRFGAPKIEPNDGLRRDEFARLKNPAFSLDAKQREVVVLAIKEVCSFRKCAMYSQHVRSNHVHVVVSATDTPEKLMNAFKSYATRKLREAGLVESDTKIWSRHGSTKYLWTEEHIDTAVHYVMYGQGEDLPRFD